MNARPKKVNILGITYKIEYKDKPSEVDIHKRYSYWGQIDYWTRTIRIYDDGNIPDDGIFQVIIHEIMHGIVSALNIDCLKSKPDKACNDDLDVLSVGLSDVLVRNNFVSFDDE